jgi:hypothetical protein
MHDVEVVIGIHFLQVAEVLLPLQIVLVLQILLVLKIGKRTVIRVSLCPNRGRTEEN